MARQLLTITDTWQTIANGIAVFDVEKKGAGTLLFNQLEDDLTAHKDNPEAGDQYFESEERITKCKVNGYDGTNPYIILVDGVL